MAGSRRGASRRPRRSSGEILALLARHDAPALQNALANQLMRQGIQRFVLETLTSLNHAVGDAWMRGELAVFEEHLYSEQVQAALRTGNQRVSAADRRTEGAADDIPRGTARHGTADGRGAAGAGGRAVHLARRADADRGHPPRRLAHDVHVVALSFSGAFPVRQAGDGLATLRRQLPPKMALWAGGEMTRRVRKSLPGVALVPDLAAAIEALKAWRAEWAATARPPRSRALIAAGARGPVAARFLAAREPCRDSTTQKVSGFSDDSGRIADLWLESNTKMRRLRQFWCRFLPIRLPAEHESASLLPVKN